MSETTRHFRLHRAFGLLLVLTVFFRSGDAAAQQRVAVLEVRGGMETSAMSELSLALRSGVEDGLKRSGATVMDRAQTKPASANCLSDGCELAVGQSLRADYVISGSIFDFEGRIMCTLNVYDIGAGQMVVTEKVWDSDLAVLSGKISKTMTTITAGVFKVRAIASEVEAVVEAVEQKDVGGFMDTAARLAQKVKGVSGAGGDVVVTTSEFTDTGWFVTPRFGTSMVHGAYSQWLKRGAAVRLEAGRSGEPLGYGVFLQGTLHNGEHFDDQGERGCTSTVSCIQGDVRIFKYGGLTRYVVMDSVVRVITQAAAGMATIPLLIDEKYYQEEVVEVAWLGQGSTVHEKKIHVFTNVGAIVEYPMEGTGVGAQLSVESSYISGFGLGTEILAGFNATF